MDKKELAKAIIKEIGGSENINQSWHCITRLRFNYKDKDQINLEKIRQLEGVLGAQFQSGQFQIIIGNEVTSVYAEISQLLDGKIQESTKSGHHGNPIEVVLDTISGIFTPLLPAITGGGLLKGVMALLVAMKLLSETSSSYEILAMISDAPFHFLPFLIAYSAAKRFKTDQSLAVTLAGILMYPTIMNYANGGEVNYLKFLGINVPMNNYASSVLPIILGVLLLSYIHKYMNQIVPKSVKIIFVPLLTLVITAPILLMVIAPLGNYIGVYLERFFATMFAVAGPLAGMLMGGLMPLIVITGMHYAFFPETFASLDKVGYDIMLLPMNFVANLAQAGAVLGVLIKTKDKKMKQLSFSTIIPAIFGITEPAIYGVTMKLKKPFYASLAGGAIGGAIFGLFNVKSFAFAVPGIMSLPSYLEKGTNNFMLAVIGIGVSFSVSLIITLLLNFEESSIETQQAEFSQPVLPINKDLPIDVLSPLSGEIYPLETVPDATFSNEMVGKGVAIMPNEEMVKAPFSGTVTMLTSTNHAIGLTSDEGVELLIHIGLETVELAGKGFDLLVTKGQSVKRGQDILAFDLETMKKAGMNMISPIVVTNSSQYLDVIHTANLVVTAGESKLLMLIN